MKILNFSKTFKNGVFGDFEILKFSSNKPPLVLVLRKTRGGLLLETGLIQTDCGTQDQRMTGKPIRAGSISYYV